jgi:DNA-binding transcriptional ArsR family regulator
LYVTTSIVETALTEIHVSGERHGALFDVLSNARRRFVLAALLTADRAVSVSELTTDIVRWETEMASSTAASASRDEVEISLLHSHLPKMAEAGLISYESNDETIRLAGRADHARTHLEPVGDD